MNEQNHVSSNMQFRESMWVVFELVQSKSNMAFFSFLLVTSNLLY